MSIDRREFVKLMGASAALATCTRQPAEHLLPYHRAPDGLTPGNPQHYATSMTVDGVGTALLVTAREGRPVKIEGNPDHPLVRGASGPLEQAELLSLYDPHRARTVTHGGRPSSKGALFDELERLVHAASQKDRGRTVRFLSEPSGSPLLTGLRARILERLPNARFVSWSPLAPQQRYDGAKLAFGRPFEPLYDFSRARVVLALDDDFLSARGANLGGARAWADRRTPGPQMSRLYVVEPAPTVTGSMADHRLALRGGDLEGLLRALVLELAASKPALAPLAGASKGDRFVAAVAKDLLAAGKEALITVGDRQPPVVHALAHAVNSELGAVGSTVKLCNPALAETSSGPHALKTLADELAQGQVDTLVITSWNPAYCAYGNVDLAGLLKRTQAHVIYLGLYEDETAALSRWFAPKRHGLESWGDARALDGSILFQQPLVEPLYPEALSEAQLLAAFVGDGHQPPMHVLRESWRRRQGVQADEPGELATFTAMFERWLQAGFVANSAFEAETPLVDVASIARVPPRAKAAGALELQLQRDEKVYDGRAGSSAWLQELPDPSTKLVWDNAALMSEATAKTLGASERVKLTTAAGSVVAPVLVVPGHAEGCVTLSLGYGRRAPAEPVALGVGVDAYAVRGVNAPWFCTVEAAAAPGARGLVTTDGHWKLEGKEPALVSRVGEPPKVRERLSHLNDDAKGEARWGMAIDLNRCTGCSACVVACQAENNIPVVGKSGVQMGREMHWIRVDRYVVSGAVVSQPVTCQHCEDAPCEKVCPTDATTHSDEGLNDMTYSRCIGAQRCASNCPYKVRRFNYLDHSQALQPVERLRMNPEVTVRERGVMEKCTFCVQRIERARIESHREGTALSVRTACQQACPTGAIAFGSLSDPASEVSKWHLDERRYALLQELGTRPRNAYLERVKNPNPELA